MNVKTQTKYDIYDWQGNTAATTSLTVEVSENTAKYIVHRALIKEQNNKKPRTASSKTRSEVRGGGRKPWKQKGTGRARAGSNTSPLWKGGGVTFGPKSKINRLKMNKKEWRLALKTTLHNRSKDIKIVENFENQFNSPNTRSFIEALKKWNISPTQKILLITENDNVNLKLSIRNIPNIIITTANNARVTELLKASSIIITVNALSKLQEVYND